MEIDEVVGTGVFLSTEEYSGVTALVKQTVRIDLARGMNTYETDTSLAVAELQRLAREKGLPELGEGKSYGLTSDRRIVGPAAEP